MISKKSGRSTEVIPNRLADVLRTCQCRIISLICFENSLLQISGSTVEITRIPQMGKPSNCTPILVCQLTETLLRKLFNAYLMRGGIVSIPHIYQYGFLRFFKNIDGDHPLYTDNLSRGWSSGTLYL